VANYENEGYLSASASSNGISIGYGIVVLAALFTLVALGRLFGSIRVGGEVAGGI
jgi:hypothetical protein